MRYKKLQILMILIAIILSSLIIYATTLREQYTFDNGLITENLTFSGGENITRFFTLQNSSILSYASLNISGFDSGGDYPDNISVSVGETSIFNGIKNSSFYNENYVKGHTGGALGGITSNSTTEDIDTLFLVSWGIPDFIYFVDENFKAVKNISIGSLGIEQPDLVIYKNNSLWITDEDDNFVYHMDLEGNNITDGVSFSSFTNKPILEGMTTNGSDVWIVSDDSTNEFIHLDHDFNFIENFTLGGTLPCKHVSSTSIRGLITDDGTNFWYGAIYGGTDYWCRLDSSGNQLQYRLWSNLDFKENIANFQDMVLVDGVDLFSSTGGSTEYVERHKLYNPFSSEDILLNEFSSTINSYLDNCDIDANGNCSVPINFFSQTAGIIEYDAINFSYKVSNVAPEIEFNGTDPPTPLFNNSVTIVANITDKDGNGTISYVAFSLYAPNGTRVIDSENGTWDGVIRWESSSYLIDDAGTWIWGVNSTDLNAANVSGGGEFTITDNQAPNVTLENPINKTYESTETNGLSNMSLNYTTFDNVKLSSCWYNVSSAEFGTEIADTNLTNCQNVTFDVTRFANYTLYLNSNDTQNNVNITELKFVVKQQVTPNVTVVEGGGGGGGIIFLPGLTEQQLFQATNFSVKTTSYTNVMDFVISKGSVKPREKIFYLTNNGIEPVQVSLICDTTTLNETNGQNNTIDICDYVEFEQDNVTISPNVLEPTEAKILITSPENISFGDQYSFNILALQQIGETDYNFAKLSVQARAPIWAVILKWSFFPGQDKDLDLQEMSKYPVAPIAIFLGFIMFMLVFLTLRQKLQVTSFLLGLLFFLITSIVLIFAL